MSIMQNNNFPTVALTGWISKWLVHLPALTACGLAVSALSSAAKGQCTANEFQKLLADDGNKDDAFGLSVSVSGDVAIVGAFFGDGKETNSGAAYIFQFDGTSWNQQAKLFADDGTAGDNFGLSVSISSDVAIVGAPYDDESGERSGSAYIFRFDGTNWMQEAGLLGNDTDANDQFGFSVSISDNVALVGTYFAEAAYVFRFDGTSWNQEGKLLASDGMSGDHFGIHVSISGDVAIIGAPDADGDRSNSGSAYIFRYDPDGSESWTQEAKLLTGNRNSMSQFGISVSIDGNLAIVGVPRFYKDKDGGITGVNTGAAFVFRYDPDGSGSWTPEATLLADDGEAGDALGYSVSINGDMAIATAPHNRNNGQRTGSAYVFRYDPNGTKGWNQQAKLLASDGESDDFFGQTRFSSSISGDTAFVTAPYDDNENGDRSGAAYVFTGLGDCNVNGTADICDITDGDSQDENGNGIPDECEGECTGQEKMKKPKCKLKNGVNKLKVKVINSTPSSFFTVELSTGLRKSGQINDDGKGKVRFKRLPTGDGTATATWGCGVTQSRNYSCP